MNLEKLSLGLAIVTLVLLQHSAEQAVGEPIQIVSPSRYADREGTGAATQPQAQGRWQQVLPASDFVSLLPGYKFITQMAWRPDGSLGGPLTTSFDSLLVRLSTTAASPPNLSRQFSENIGSDETVVFDGPLNAHTDNVGPAGGPKEFDGIIAFEPPFEYDPNNGNLLVDMRWIRMSATSMDIVSFPGVETQLIWSTNLASGTATLEGGGVVLQFTFAAEPLLGDTNLDGEVNGLDVDPFIGVLLNGPFQPAADMNEDQVVNGLDVDPFVAAVVGDGVQQIPEPSTLLLALVALAVVGGWRKWGE